MPLPHWIIGKRLLKMTSPMTDMREVVARAILALVPVGYGMTPEEATEYAKAAIEAMRECSDEMLIAAHGTVFMKEKWRRMIDAALEGK